MTEFFFAFITGLTTGGLSCLAVQGGLLASSLAHQIEHDISLTKDNQSLPTQLKYRIAQPIILFLSSKLVAYTLLGFLLGWLGSMLQLTPVSRAVLQIGVGIFIFLTGLRLLTNHPWLRFFAFEPPSFITRTVRKVSKGNDTWLTPTLLGFLTVFIPCGVTQAMMAVAMGSGSPMFGAGVMAAFILGTTPVFFTLAYFTTKLSSRIEKHFTRLVAIVVLILGVISIESGLNLLGFPYTFTNFSRSVTTNPIVLVSKTEINKVTPTALPTGCCSKQQLSDKATTSQAKVDAAQSQTLTLYAKNNGYEPSTLNAPADIPITLNIITENTVSCSRAFVIPSLNAQVVLPESGTTPLEIPAQKAGTQMPFSCSMGMYTGTIIFQ